MTHPLLESKLFVPPRSASLVDRPRLASLLDRGARSKLTLVSAPAGFGKTTLLADWLARTPAEDRSIAWVSLDQADGEAASFWTYVATALQRAAPSTGAALSLLLETQPPIDAALATLLNELAAVDADLVLVLDDYHAIDTPDIHRQVGFLLEHLPPRAHLVIASRSDPPLLLARMRARGDMVEIRAADLRFTHDEATAYLTGAGLDLDESEITTLEERTEGWIAALQLAALSIGGRNDVAGFIAGFAGDDRYVVDFLVEEALARQPEAIRRFLLETCILERLSGSLCDAVTGHPGGRATLESLERANLFVVPLDARRVWYRYHHLFAEMLRARLLDEEPELVARLHRRASEWFEQHGDTDDAIRHALAGEAFERAALLIEQAVPALRRARREATMRRWFEALPEELFASRPVLSIGYVGALMANGELEEVEARLQDAERWLTPAALTGQEPAAVRPGMVVTDEGELRRLPGAIAMYRAAQAQLRGDLEGTLAHAQRALELAGDDDPLGRGGAAGFLALAHWGQGELEGAQAHWADAMASLQRAGHVVDAVGCARPLAEIRFAQGRLHEAQRTYERGLQLATTYGTTVLRGAADMHVGMSELSLEWNDLDTAAQHLQAAAKLGEQGGLAQNPYRWCVAMAQVREAEGATEAALQLLDQAERLYVSEYFPLVRPIAALRARMWGAAGRLGDAMAWVRAQRLTVEDDLSYAREYEHVTLARLLMARWRDRGDGRSMGDAAALLERLLEAAETGGRQRSVIEVLVLMALAHDALGDRSAALAHLARALAAAEDEGYVRTFVAEGPPMAALLSSATKQSVTKDHARRLLQQVRGSAGPADDRMPNGQRLPEPLSERELDVLRLLGTDLDGPAIARELVVALSTVRSHTKSIYAKLGVNSRRAAVRRGQELGLPPR